MERTQKKSLKQFIKRHIKSIMFSNKLPLLTIYNRFLGHNKLNIGRDSKIVITSSVLKKVIVKNQGKNNTLIIGPGCRLNNVRFNFKGNNNIIEIKESVTAKDATFCFEDNNNKIVIGKQSILAGEIYIDCIEGTSILIGENCLFSREIRLMTGDSHSILDLEAHRINPSQNIVIDNHVWVGYRAVLLKGTFVSENSIIAAGALVTKKFDKPNIVIAGNPAKIVKYNINWDAKRL